MGDFLFSIVLSAEHVVDIFFWLTAFIGSFFILVKLQDKDSTFSVAMLYLNRLVRLLPLYMFVMFFFWKFLVLYGGDGPLFYQYHTNTECQRFWFWHAIFLNNLVPWAEHDNCLPWTWYLANDFQFFLILPILAYMYIEEEKRKRFYYVIGGILGVCTIV